MMKPQTVDEYIAIQPEDVQALLTQVREAIRKAAPKATEVISYSMPAFKQQGILVWYAAAKAHIGLYPRPQALLVFKDELSKYKSSKGAVQFPLDGPMPLKLISKIVKYRVAEDAAEAEIKKMKKAKKK
jgi:uncharacterized protein YdhG (YjbR/CyaY superfamily)